MFDRIFANYLVDKQKIGPECLEKIFELQEQKRVRLGVIAVSEKLMTNDQVEEVNQLQSNTDKKFGDIAVEKGYLTENQVTRLLALQGNSFLSFVQATVDLKYLTMNDIVDSLNEFQQENSYTLTDMDNLKSCDIDRIIPIYVYDLPGYLKEVIGVAARTMARLVDYHLYIDKPYLSDKFITENLCSQCSKGDFTILLGLSGSDTAMIKGGIGFAGEQYIDELDDALDSLCELINCINGIFATDVSRRGVNIDMLAPYYKAGPGAINAEGIVNVPIHIFDKSITLSVVLSDNYTIE